MKIKDIINMTAVLLDEVSLLEYLENKHSLTDDNSEEYRRAKSLVELCNFVINESATEYIVFKKTESINDGFDKIYFSNLQSTPLKIYNVLDANGNELTFKVCDEYVLTSPSVTKISYSYLPKKYDFNEETEFDESQISLRALSYGLASEYCMTICRFDESILWHNKFMNALSVAIKPKNKEIKKRRWA